MTAQEIVARTLFNPNPVGRAREFAIKAALKPSTPHIALNAERDAQAEARALGVLRRGIDARVFPGAAFAVLNRGTRTAGSVGHFTYESDSPAVTPSTIYDLASLTKPIATTTAAMLLYDRGKLELDASLASVLPHFAAMNSARRQVTFRMLLAHTSG